MKRVFVVLTSALMAVGLTGCDNHPTEHHWKKVSHLNDTAADLFFVVVEPKYTRDQAAYNDAGDTLCEQNLCEVGFFATRNDVPNETLSADFFRHGGWKDRHETAHFVRNSATGLRRLAFDCSRFPQTYSNNCLLPLPGPTPATLAAAQKRGVLVGLGDVKFGMSLPATTAALGGDGAVTVLDGGGLRTILRTKVALYGRSFNGFYNILPSGFGLALLKWSELLNEDACVSTAKAIATALAKDYGDADQFGYYEEGQKLLHYSWLFKNGATITLTNLEMKDGDCPLTLTYASKADAD